MVKLGIIRPLIRGRMALAAGRAGRKGNHPPAPFHSGLVPGDSRARISALSMTGDDGQTCRIAYHRKRSPKGTVLIFPGRGECAEKWEDAMASLSAMGYGSCLVEWRGQGMSGRRLGRGNVQHVDEFRDYQRDAALLMDAAGDLGMAKPWHILAHSMGGMIAFRAALEGFPAETMILSAPMFGFDMNPLMKGMAILADRASPFLGGGDRPIPGMPEEPYAMVQGFEGNLFTTHAPSYAALEAACRERPDLHAANPSVRWLREALGECARMETAKSPAVPCLFLYGNDERVVSPAAIESRFRRWPRAERLVFNRGRHDVFMESRGTRSIAMERIRRFLENGA